MTGRLPFTGRLRRGGAGRRRARGGLRVLAYHRVADPERTPELEPALVSATPVQFRNQMEHLARRYRVLSLEQVLAAFRRGHALRRRSVLLTFDDGYRDFAENAWPVLKHLRLPASLFVPTAYPGRPDRAFWWDRLHRLLGEPTSSGDGPTPVDAPPLLGQGQPTPEISRMRSLMKGLTHEEVERLVDHLGERAPCPNTPTRPAVLDWDELRTLAREGLALGAHTRWHAPLTCTDEARVREELRGSLEELRARTGPVPAVVTYPYGFHDERVVGIARQEGFELGFTCITGQNRVGRTDPLRLRRTNVTRNTVGFLFRLRMRPWFATVDRWRQRDGGPTSPEASAAVERLRTALGNLSTPQGEPREEHQGERREEHQGERP